MFFHNELHKTKKKPRIRAAIIYFIKGVKKGSERGVKS